MQADTRHTEAELRKRVSFRRRVVLLISTVAVFTTLVGTPLAAQGFIMRDGAAPCDPIRHMGC
jgi:hypothetical protein